VGRRAGVVGQDRAAGGPELGAKKRLDVELVNKGFAASRAEAGALVAAGRVLVSGAVADKVSRQVGPSEAVLVTGPPPRFASRGGEKLDSALARFGVEVRGLDVLDAGASTGGFTDCLLQRGAASVLAVDVGHGQLDPRLREDARVQVMERANVRYLAPGNLGDRRFDVVVADLSFISLRTVASALVSLTKPDGCLVVLVKPQFEAGRAAVTKGKGVVRDAGIWATVLSDVAAVFEAAGASVAGGMVSPLLGAQGNVEFFLYLLNGAKKEGVALSMDDLAASAVLGARGAPPGGPTGGL
jgi:23S rRNA (cytidine1920-2'-O)/16S rRNA (cytidine1409-2'-O)-methyltransferase